VTNFVSIASICDLLSKVKVLADISFSFCVNELLLKLISSVNKTVQLLDRVAWTKHQRTNIDILTIIIINIHIFFMVEGLNIGNPFILMNKSFILFLFLFLIM